jgi:hypothetical protein
MSEHINLFGKKCNSDQKEYTLLELYNMANKIKLITTRQNYNLLCGILKDYFDKNGIQNEIDLEGYNPEIITEISEPSTRQLGKNIDIDILLNSNPDDLLVKLEYFQNFKNYSQYIKKIGNNSSNGFIRKLQYVVNDRSYSIILKGNQIPHSDSLVYEFLVGQCINEYSKFYPCFARTYMIGLFKSEMSYSVFNNMHNDVIIDKPFDFFIQQLSVDNLENMVNNGCKYNKHLVLFNQYLPITETLDDFLKNISKKTIIFNYYYIQNKFNYQLYNLTAILHMIYQCLSSFAYMFTHYDLHLNNVGLIKVPDNKFIHIIYHYPNGKIVHYNTIYIPVIIDYGRCFINCQKLNPEKTNSKEIMKKVCSNDVIRKPYVGNCIDICGNQSGYNFSTNYNDETDIFEKTSLKNHFIDYTRRNISHDCRLLNEIRVRFSFNLLNNNIFIVPKLKELFNILHPMDERMGTREIEYTSKSKTIDNVIMSARKLTEIISEPQFNIVNNLYMNSRTLYGTLHIWTDLSLPFKFN